MPIFVVKIIANWYSKICLLSDEIIITLEFFVLKVELDRAEFFHQLCSMFILILFFMLW